MDQTQKTLFIERKENNKDDLGKPETELTFP